MEDHTIWQVQTTFMQTLSRIPTNYNATAYQVTALLINCINVKIVITDMQHMVC